MECGEEVHPHGLFKLIGCEDLDGTYVDDPGVVNQNIDAAEAGEGLGDHTLAFGWPGQVSRDEIEIFRTQVRMPGQQRCLCSLQIGEAARRENEIHGPLRETGGYGKP